MNLLELTEECRDAAKRHWPGMVDGVHTHDGKHKKDTRVFIPVFVNRVVENVFARAHPIVPIVWTAPLMAFGVYRSWLAFGAVRALLAFLAGWLVWTFLEYVLHRFVFHMVAETPEARQRSFLMHGYHHEYPRDRLRLVAPPIMAWPPGVIVFSAYWAVLGSVLGPALFAGTAAGYVAYDWIHYYTHHFRPQTALGKWLKRYHLMHHHDEAHTETRFGVSSPLWDFVFGTYVPLDAPRSDKRGSSGESAAAA